MVGARRESVGEDADKHATREKMGFNVDDLYSDAFAIVFPQACL